MKRRTKLALTGLVLVGAGTVALPTLLSATIAPSLVRDAIAAQVNGTVDVDGVDLGWGGPQRVRGVTVRGADGTTTATLDVALDASLFSLLTDRTTFALTVSGAAHARVDADGHLSLLDLVAASPDDDSSGSGSGGGGGRATDAAARPAVTLSVDGVTLTLEIEDGAPEPMILDGVTGTAALLARDADVALDGAVRRGAVNGTFELDATATALFDASGALDLPNATLDVALEVDDAPLPFTDAADVVDRATFTVASDHVGTACAVTLDASLALADGVPSHAHAALTITEPLTLADALDEVHERVVGTVNATQLPASLVQPWLARIDRTTDAWIGARLDVALERAESGAVSGSITAPRGTATFAAQVDRDRAVRNGSLTVTWTIDDAISLVDGVRPATGAYAIRAEGRGIHIPALATGALDVTQTTGAVSMTMDGAIPVWRAEDATDAPALDVTTAVLTLDRAQRDAPIALDATVRAGTEVEVHVAGAVRPEAERVTVTGGTAESTVPAALVHALTGLEAETAALHAPLAVTAQSRPITLRATETGWTLDGAQRLAVRVAPLEVHVGAIDATLGVHALAATLERADEAAPWTMLGSAQLRRGAELLTTLALDAQYDSAAARGSGTVTANALRVADVATLLDIDPQRAVSAFGATGSVELALARDAAQRAELTLDFDRLDGTCTAALQDDTLTIARAALRTQLEPELVRDAMLTEDETSSFEILAPLPIEFTLDRVQLPLATFDGAAIDPDAIRGAATFVGGPLALATPDGEPLALDELRGTVTLDALRDGVPLHLEATVPAFYTEESDGPGTLVIDGAVINVLDANDALALDAGQLTAEASFTALPTAFIDAVGRLDGVMVASIGEVIDGTASFTEFSKQSGWVDLDLTSSNGTLTGWVRGLPASFQTATIDDRRLRGSLRVTPEFSARVLRFLSPLFQTVVSAEAPVRFECTDKVLLSHDGDLSRLRGDVRVDVGRVWLTPSADLFGILALAGEGRKLIEGRMPPATFTIRRGVVSTEDLTLELDRFTIRMTGSVDLVSETVECRWSVPVSGLAQTFHELEGLEHLDVPLITRGSIDDPKTQIAPEFVERMLQAGAEEAIRRGLEDLFRKLGGG